MSTAIREYLEMCGYERKLSANTVKAYRIDLDQFSKFTEGQWADKKTLSNYIKYLNQKFLPCSVKRKIASIWAFYQEEIANGVTKENPFDKFQLRLQTPQQLPRVIPEEVVHSLLQSAYNSYDPARRTTLRDIVVLELLFSTGLRVSELCALSDCTFQLGIRFCNYSLMARAGKNESYRSPTLSFCGSWQCTRRRTGRRSDRETPSSLTAAASPCPRSLFAGSSINT